MSEVYVCYVDYRWEGYGPPEAVRNSLAAAIKYWEEYLGKSDTIWNERTSNRIWEYGRGGRVCLIERFDVDT